MHAFSAPQIFKVRVQDLRPWSIDTIPVWHIYRRYSDFLTLFHRVKNAFPLLAHDFPPRKWLGNQFEPVFVARRINRLQAYVDTVLADEEVRAFPAVKEFFCFDNPPQNTASMSFDRVCVRFLTI